MQRDALLDSFKLVVTRLFWKAALFDLLMILAMIVLGGVFYFAIGMVNTQVMPDLVSVNEMKLMGVPGYEDALADLQPQITNALWSVTLIMIASALLFIFFLTILYGKAWSIIKRERASLRHFKKLFLVNMLWFLGWFMILLLTSFAFTENIVVYIVAVELVFLLLSDFVMRSLFSERENVLKLLKRTGGLCFRKIHWFLVFMLVLIIMLNIVFPIPALLAGSLWLFLPVFTIILLLLVGFSRAYAVALVDRLK